MLPAISYAEDRSTDAILKTLADALHGLGDEEDFHVFELTGLGLGVNRTARTWSRGLRGSASIFRVWGTADPRGATER